MDLAELRANIASLTNGAMLDSRNYATPRRKVIVYDFLTHIDINHSTDLTHLFNPTTPLLLDKFPSSHGLVIHNHGDDRPCYTPDFCFLFGYEPSEVNHPGFRKAFWSKNARYFEGRSLGISGSSNSVRSNPRTKGHDSNWTLEFPSF